MQDKVCGNCEYGLMSRTGVRICVKHNIYYVSDTDSCPSYFNYRKEQIYNQIIRKKENKK